jgi:CheY-like chemotaxis protein
MVILFAGAVSPDTMPCRGRAVIAASGRPRMAASFNARPARRCDAAAVALRCLIVDDNASFLQTAGALLERQGLTIAGVASNSADAVRRTGELRPDVVLVDIVLGSESGLELARRLAADELGSPAVILVSTHAETDFADLIEQTPAAGFVPKSELSAEAIRRLAD